MSPVELVATHGNRKEKCDNCSAHQEGPEEVDATKTSFHGDGVVTVKGRFGHIQMDLYQGDSDQRQGNLDIKRPEPVSHDKETVHAIFTIATP